MLNEYEKTYVLLAQLLQARANCERSGNAEWFERHTEKIERIMRSTAPSGSGFDSGTSLNFERSNASRLVFTTAFHHMNEDGYYDGWTEHTVTAHADLASGFTLSISGRDRNEIKDYIADTFNFWLNDECKK